MSGDCEDSHGRIPSKATEFCKASCTHRDLNPSTHRLGPKNIHNRTNTTFSKWPIYLGPRHKGEFGHKEITAKQKLQQQISLDFGGEQLKQHTHTNSIALLGKHHREHLLHQISNSNDQKKSRLLLISWRGLFSSLKLWQKSQELPVCCGHTSVPQCLGTEPASIDGNFSVPHYRFLAQTGSKGIGAPASSRLQE